MSFIDMAYLRKENIRNGVCTYYRRKTKQQVEVQVNDGMQRIIESFTADVRNSPYLFPIITGEGLNARLQYESALRTQNRRLKTLSKLADIKDNRLTTHVSRHTWATITREGGLPVGAISEMLGHTTEKMTHNYFASFGIAASRQAYNILCNVLARAPTG
jgi:integrase